MSQPASPNEEGIAVIGMSLRLPGARNPAELWNNLRQGVESITTFSDAELLKAGTPPEALADPKFVRAKGVLPDVEYFDAAFFGILPKDAELMDPQQRFFLECAWEALEQAGYDPERCPVAVGIYAGAYIDTYLLANLCTKREFLDEFITSIQVGSLQTELGNDKDYLATRVAFKLNLRGPAMTLQTACSTSLVAITQACQSLLTYQCDMALAGGVTITLPQVKGYFYKEDGMLSPDGHCRAFDAESKGTVFSNGAGVILLKRLSEAIADGDHIHAIIKGAAVNNDGGVKLSYTAPSVDGQAEVIAMAHGLAGISADTIGYVEAHGTGTPLGDPIEITALTKAFQASTDKTGFCAIGSLKTNIGHLDVASGVCGLIKTALALQHRQIPPSLHFTQPNPKIDFASSPFFVNTTLADWKSTTGPRRAGVSSFGVGGTNAHVVMEEAPVVTRTPSRRPRSLLLLSARTPEALASATSNLGRHLTATPDLNLADVAYTLQTGRKAFSQRRLLVCAETAEAAQLLEAADPKRVLSDVQRRKVPPVAFMFPGQGAQQVNMAGELYRCEPYFKQTIDDCAERLKPHLGLDLRDVLFPAEPSPGKAQQLTQTLLAQPSIFVVEYALARLWMHWGVQPEIMAGHSVGEFVAACLAGVFSLEDGLMLLALRGRLMQNLPGGCMLSVRMPEDQLKEILPAGLDLAAVNGPSLCVVSGPEADTASFEELLTGRKVAFRRLHTSHGFHSRMMDPVLATFTDAIRKIALHPPRLAIVSTVTGERLTEKEATNPEYWAGHLRRTVRFLSAAQKLWAQPELVLLEVGPGQTLTTLTRQNPDKTQKQVILSTLGHAENSGSDYDVLLTALGRLWTTGVTINWESFHADERRYRTHLPTYPFERKKFWINPTPATPTSAPINSSFPALPTAETAPSPSMNAIPTPVQPVASRIPALLGRLKGVLSELSGIEENEMDPGLTFLELGFDSLLLTQVSKAFQDEFGVKVTMRQLIDNLSTPNALVGYLDTALPPEAAPTPVVPAAPAASAPAASAGSLPAINFPAIAAAGEGASVVERIMNQQLQVMAQQLAMLRGAPAPTMVAAPVAAPKLPVAAPQAPAVTATPADADAAKTENKAFGPYKAIDRSLDKTLSPQQVGHIEELIRRYNQKTPGSKRLTQQYRQWYADPRTASGFNRLWKEMCYQIAMSRSSGSRLLDIDGNEYIDMLNGFGPNFLGHSPQFVTTALQAQLEKGIEVGPQSPLAGEVARMFCEFTGNERVSFVNTGSEAVQAAMRLARTVTGRDKIAIFNKDYHGNFDEVLVRGNNTKTALRSFPIAPGIPRRAVEDMYVLDYGSDEALAAIKAHAGEIAAVFVEPIQSRRPEFQPREFVKALRKLTEEHDIIFVFDEVITGLRDGPGGAQAYYGVKADLATYGKVIGGGMPIGLVAGRADLMDTFDGGVWQYGDTSFPEKGVTFFAGTFVRHPLAIAAAHATLTHLKSCGPEYWERINKNTTRLAGTLDRLMEENGIPIRIPHFCSQMFVRVQEDCKYGNLLFYHLREKGVFILENFPSYMTAAHTDEDIDFVIRAFTEGLSELQEVGFFPGSKPIPHPGRTGVALSLKPRLKPAGPVIPAPVVERGPFKVPVTEAQREIFLACQMGDDASCAYNEATSLRLRGPLNEPALRDAIQGLVDRHDALRSVFTADGESVEIRPKLQLEIATQDLSSLDQAGKDAKVRELTGKESVQPFDLVHGPLFRAIICTLDGRDHVILLTAHHIVCDGWSFNVVAEEISRLYSAGCQGKTADLQPARQFSDYALWQAGQQNLPATAEIEAFWLKQHAEPVPPLDLPVDRPRPALRTYNGSTERHQIDGALYREVKRMGAKQGCTLYASLLAAFEVLLSRLGGQTDLVIGIPAAGQSIEGNANMIGHCVNFLPLRARLDEKTTYREHLVAVKRSLLDAYEHQNYTYGRLIPKLNLPRDPSRLPLVEVEFNVERMDYFEKFFQLETEFEPLPKRFANFNLFLNIIESEAGLTLDCDYNTDLFDATTIQRWLAGFEALLRSAVQQPDARIADLAALDTAERNRVVLDWNNTDADYSQNAGVHDLFTAVAARTPNAVAIVAEGREMTYRELDQRSNRLAHYLKKLGVGSETLVGICMDPSAQLLVGLLGIMKAGGAYVPLDPAFPADRLTFMVGDARAPVLITQESLANHLPVNSAKVVKLDTDWDSRIARESDAALESENAAERLAYVIYTSGSTGKPKGVRVGHRAVVNFLESMAREPGIKPEDVLLAVTTLSFDIAGLELFLPLTTGARVVLVTREIATDGMQLFEQLANSRTTIMQATPATWKMLIEAGWQGSSRMKILCGGEPLSRDLANQLLPRCGSLWNMYGPTETTIWSTISRIEPGSGPIDIGHPIANTQVYVVNEAMQPVPIGVPGELLIGGDGVARDYLNRPELTAEKFMPNPFKPGTSARVYRTGDRARWLPNGRLECLGRVDHQVKVRGFRIELGEIEIILRTHPAVRDAAVIVREDAPGDRRLVGYVVGSNGTAPESSSLRELLQKQLPDYMVPGLFVTLPALPLTPNGKVDRRALPAPDLGAIVTRANFVAPRNTTEEKIASIWMKVLRVDRVGVHDDIFDLGGDSLLIFQIATHATKEGLKLAPRQLFQHRTIAALYDQVLSNIVAADSSAAPKDPAAESRNQTIKRAPRQISSNRS